MTSSSVLAARYLDLMIELINGSAYGPQSYLRAATPRSRTKRYLTRALRVLDMTVARRTVVPADAYEKGVGWPPDRGNIGYSMVGRRRLLNIKEACSTAIEENVEGHFIEAGVWKGGSCLLMRAILVAHNVTDRKVFIADSFRGLPSAEMWDDAFALHYDTTLAIGRDEVEEAFRRHGLLDGQIEFIDGWFKDTLPSLRSNQWAVIRLDGDMYESTMDGLENLYPGLSEGGFLIVDDYLRYQSCRRAVDEYRRKRDISDPMIPIDEDSIYWRKSTPRDV